MTRALLLAALAAALTVGPAAYSQEVIAAGRPTGAPPAGAAPARLGQPLASPVRSAAEANGAWARDVLAGRSTAADDGEASGPAPRPGCVPAAERKPHGEVWVGAGTRGYREAGGVVTAPLGDCGQLTISVDKTDGPNLRRHR
jgi:hypothetical protein